MEVRIDHELGRAAATERLHAAAERLDVELEAGPGEHEGGLKKTMPLGPVESRFEVHDDHVVVTLTKKPAFLPESMITRALEQGLREELASS